MRLVAFLNVPAAVGLMALAHPVISLVYEHGRFGAADASATADALVFYAVGLYGYSAVKVFAPAFYAIDEARIPVIGSVVGMTSNVALVLLLHPVLGFKGIALGTALAATANFAVLAAAWKWRHGGLGNAGVYRQLGRTLLASAAMVGVVLAVKAGIAPHLPAAGLGRQAPLALVPIAAGAFVYFAASRVLGVKELSEVASALRRRRRT
jgi:putative peptidoglycan lipid II flippase